MKQIKLYALLLAVVFAACTNDDDLYKDLAGGGDARYVGKCKNLTVEEGWKRLKLNWENSMDPAIEKIKIIALQGEDTIMREELPAGTTSYETEAIFANKSTELIITAIDLDGNVSLPTSVYTKAFDYSSELVSLWASLRRTHYFIKDETSGKEKMVLFMYDTYTELDGEITWIVQDATISYSVGGVKTSRPITEEELYAKRLVLEEVDSDAEIAIEKNMKIDECYDPIHFPPTAIPKKTDADYKNYAPDFMNVVKTKYDLATNAEAIACLDTMETIYFDRDISSMENIMYMPKLKKVVLGGNRFMYAAFVWAHEDNCSAITDDVENSKFALQTMHDLKGLELKTHAKHYGLDGFFDWAERDMSSARYQPTLLPEEEVGALTEDGGFAPGWKISSNAELSTSGSLLSLLGGKYTERFETMWGTVIPASFVVENNLNAYWSPITSTDEVRSHEIVYDMLEEKHIKNFYFAQYFKNGASDKDLQFMPEVIEIEFSSSGSIWEPIFDTYNSIYVGVSIGEASVITPVKEVKARYLKLKVRDKVAANGNSAIVSKFFPEFVD